jgi:hypothetical protein
MSTRATSASVSASRASAVVASSSLGIDDRASM